MLDQLHSTCTWLTAVYYRNGVTACQWDLYRSRVLDCLFSVVVCVPILSRLSNIREQHDADISQANKETSTVSSLLGYVLVELLILA